MAETIVWAESGAESFDAGPQILWFFVLINAGLIALALVAKRSRQGQKTSSDNFVASQVFELGADYRRLPEILEWLIEQSHEGGFSTNPAIMVYNAIEETVVFILRQAEAAQVTENVNVNLVLRKGTLHANVTHSGPALQLKELSPIRSPEVTTTDFDGLELLMARRQTDALEYLAHLSGSKNTFRLRKSWRG